jgi:hypothetical protein
MRRWIGCLVLPTIVKIEARCRKRADRQNPDIKDFTNGTWINTRQLGAILPAFTTKKETKGDFVKSYIGQFVSCDMILKNLK